MKILMLTSPPAQHFKAICNEKRMHIGILYIISILEQEKHEVDLLDLYLLEKKLPDIMKYDFVGLYCSTVTFLPALRILAVLNCQRKRGWRGKIMAGGPHVSLFPSAFPEFVDFLVKGEGEYAVRDIVNGKIKTRITRYPRIENLDELPRPSYRHYKKLPYPAWDTKFIGTEPIATMNTSRGCVHSCAFCSVGSIWGKRFTYHSAERICDDILYLMKEFGIEGVNFREDNFTSNIQRVFDFCNLLLKKRIAIKWICETRVDDLTFELMEIMQASGCRGIYIGIEAATERLLKILNKRITLDQIRRVSKWCHTLGINIHASFITNIPEETENDKRAMIELIKEIRPQSVRINRYRGFPGSKIYDYLLRNNLYRSISCEGLLDIEDS
jgi:radical SAM superfamily enzyme YgiQ (UPF0313 family)